MRYAMILENIKKIYMQFQKSIKIKNLPINRSGAQLKMPEFIVIVKKDKTEAT